MITLLWFLLQVLILLVAGAASGVHPFTSLEQLVPLWPPSQPVGMWLERAAIAPLFRWDALHYLKLTVDGYQAGDPSASFYPLYPYLARAVAWLGFSPMTSLVLVGSLAALAFAHAFERLARVDLPAAEARWASLLVLVFPISIVLFIPYIEPLSMLLMTLCLLMARQRRWWLAGSLGALACLTKQAGIFLLIPLAMELWREAKNRRPGWQALKKWAALLLLPASMAGWSLVRSLVLEKTRLDLSNPQQSFLAILLSSNSEGMVRGRVFAWPWQVIGEAVRQALDSAEVSFHVAINLGGFLFIALLLALTWRSLRPSYRIFSLFILASSLFYFSFYECPTPITSLFRHAYHAFPIFIGVPQLFKSTRLRWLFGGVCLLLFVLLIYGYTLERWIV